MDWRIFFKAVVSVALPIALQNLLSTTASMVDTIMIGSEGELAVAAVGICSQIYGLIMSSYFGFMAGAMVFFAQFWGSGNHKGINRTLGISMTLMLLVALVFAVLAIGNPAFLLRVYTDKENIVQMAIPYMRIVGFVYPVQVITVLISMLLRSTERVKPPLYAAIAGLVTNFVINWLLIYGRFGLPKMGIAGAAVGTLFSGILNMLILLVFLIRDNQTVTLRFREIFAFDPAFIKTYLIKSTPLLCNELFYGIGQMLINMVVGRQDESAIAAMAAFRVLEGFVYAFFGGLADASAVIVGKEVGAGRPMRGYQYMKGFAVICPSITFCICLIGVLFNQPLLGLFGLGPQALAYGKYMLLIYLVMGTIRTCNYIMNGCYRAGGESVFGTVLEVTCLFTISVPATWVAGMVLHLPFAAVFAFLYTDEILRLIFELWYTGTGKWIKPVTEAGKAAIPEFRRQLAQKSGRLTNTKQMPGKQQ